MAIARARQEPESEPTQEATLTAGEPVEEHAGEEYKFVWPDYGVAIGFDMLREERGEVKGEVSIVTTKTMSNGRPGLVEWGSYNLSSDTARDRMAATLGKRTGLQSDLWWQMLKTACWRTVKTYRRGRERVDTRTYKPLPVRWLIPRFVPKGETSVFYGDGKSTKSLDCLGMMIAAVAGQAIGDWYPSEPVVGGLILDWETVEDEQVNRINRIKQGAGITAPLPIIYLGMDRMLTAAIPRVREELHLIREEAKSPDGHVIVMVDSIAWAVNGEVDAATAIPFFNALRGLGNNTTRMVVSHISKSEAAKEKGSTSPYGSIFVRNAARSAHEVRSWVQPDGKFHVGFYHRAINSGALQGDIGIEVDFHDDEATHYADGTSMQGPITFRKITIEESDDVGKGQSAAQRLMAALRGTIAGLPTSEAAKQAGVSPAVARKAFQRLRERGKVVSMGEFREPGSTGRSEGVWRLPSDQAEIDDAPPPTDDDRPGYESQLLPF